MKNILLFIILYIAFTSAKLRVHAPKVLREYYDSLKTDMKGYVKYNLANYGFNPYDHRISGRVMYPIQAQTQEDGENNIQACNALQHVNDPYTEFSQMFHSPILFIERGGCSFVTKSYNAELAGAKMVVIMDDQDEDIDNFVLVDDLSGHQLHIPTIMINKEDGLRWKEYLDQEDSDLIVSLYFEGPEMENKVDFEFWMSSLDTESYMFLETFYDEAIQLLDYTNFTPHYALYYCGSCKANNWPKTDSTLCISGGRYCSPDPDGKGPEDGRDDVLEDLRQICIYKLKGIEKWWKYVSTFRQNCIIPDPADLEVCSHSNMVIANIDVEQVEHCVENSFNRTDYDLDILLDDNYYLFEERQMFLNSKIQMWPQLIVNKDNFRGDLKDKDAPMQFICEGFKDMPEPCKKFDDRIVIKETKNNRGPRVAVEPKSYTMLYTFIIIIVLFALLIIVFLWRKWMLKRMNREMSLQVSTAVDQYFKLAQ